LAAKLVQQIEQRGAQCLEVLFACQLRPALFDAFGGGVCDRRYGPAPFGQTYEPRAAIVRVWATLDVASPLELVHRLGHRLLAHTREVGEL
jgi:hypothetical protein